MDCLSWLGYLIYIYVFFCNNGFLKTLTCFTFWIRDKFQPDYSGCKALVWTACSFSLNCLLLQWLELSIAHLLPIAHSKSLLPLQLILTHFLLSQLWKQILIENPIALKQNSISNHIFFSTNFLYIPVTFILMDCAFAASSVPESQPTGSSSTSTRMVAQDMNEWALTPFASVIYDWRFTSLTYPSFCFEH